jgi:hypothetical protein
MSLRNIGKLQPDCKALHPRKYYSSSFNEFSNVFFTVLLLGNGRNRFVTYNN